MRCGTSCHLGGLVVGGQGDRPAELAFVGEAPGAAEEGVLTQFAGPSGQLLHRLIREGGIEDVPTWFTTIVACRPPENRAPSPNEIEACKPRLDAELKDSGATVIVLLGTTATRAFLPGVADRYPNLFPTIFGKMVFRPKLPVLVPLWHPAYLLRCPNDVPKFEEGLRTVRALLRVKRQKE